MAEELIQTSGKVAIDEAVQADRHPINVYLARLGVRTRITTASTLRVLADLASDGRADVLTLPWHEMRYQHVAAIRAKLAVQYTPASANKMLAVLRGVLRECWKLGYMMAEDYHRAGEISPVKGSRLPKGRALDAGELRALFDNCARDDRAAGRRDAALLAILYGCGLRRSEAVALDLADYDSETGALKIRAGKGNKDRMAYITNGARNALADWIACRGARPGSFFVSINKGGHLGVERLTDQAVMVILQRRAVAAGVGAFSPHDLRRTFIGDLLEAGADIATVQHLAGHSQVTTTARYDRRGETTKHRAACLIHVPYSR